MNCNLDLIKKLSETSGIPGFEYRIRQVILEEIKDYIDDFSIDNMGNLLAYRSGKKDKTMLIAAHMDEIGFIVNHIDDKGFVHFLPLGGFDPKTLVAQRVVIHGKEDVVGVMASKPIHLMSADERKKPAEIQDFFIDLGRSKEEVEKIVEVGNPISRERELIAMGDCFNGKSLDNRISCYVLIETIKQLKSKELPYDVVFAFTVQEEVGLRGAYAVSLDVNPDFSLAVDTTIAFDVPGAQPKDAVSQLGQGVAIKIMDASAIADYRMVAYLKEQANSNHIQWQTELLPAGGTDTAAIQRFNKRGAVSGALSIPTRHIHQVIEMVHRNDIITAVDLLTESVLHLDNYDWSHY